MYVEKTIVFAPAPCARDCAEICRRIHFEMHNEMRRGQTRICGLAEAHLLCANAIERIKYHAHLRRDVRSTVTIAIAAVGAAFAVVAAHVDEGRQRLQRV